MSGKFGLYVLADFCLQRDEMLVRTELFNIAINDFDVKTSVRLNPVLVLTELIVRSSMQSKSFILPLT